MHKLNKSKIEKYISENAEPVDAAFYNFYFHDEDPKVVLKELQKYQNDDGGFGNALEHDLRLPYSTALVTSVAFQYLVQLKISSSEPVVQRGIKYLEDTYDSDIKGWQIIRPEADKFPHAPWWDYKNSVENFDWGNPSVELLGYLIKYSDIVENKKIIDDVKAKSVVHLNEMNDPDFHELLTYIRLYELADPELQSKLKDPLTGFISKSVNTTPDEWGSYVATPFTFVQSPDSPFISLFKDNLIDKNIEHLLEQIVNEDHWEPTWTWSGDYPKDWEVAKKEWSGKLTVSNMITLKNFKLFSNFRFNYALHHLFRIRDLNQRIIE